MRLNEQQRGPIPGIEHADDAVHCDSEKPIKFLILWGQPLISHLRPFHIPSNNLTIGLKSLPEVLVVLLNLPQVIERLQEFVLLLDASHQQSKQLVSQWSLALGYLLLVDVDGSRQVRVTVAVKCVDFQV